MSPNHSWNIHSGRSMWIRNWLELVLFISIGLMIVLLAYQGITHTSKSDTISFRQIGTNSDLTKLYFRSH